MTLSLIVPGAAYADSSWVTLQDLLDAILQRKTFTSAQRAELDLNQDTLIDVGDLVCFTSNCRQLTPKVSFSPLASYVSEGSGTINVGVTASPGFAGTVNYSVSGTASSGADFSPLSGSVALNGTSAVIAVPILNEGVLAEELETIVLTVAPGAGYQTGALGQAQLNIVDNDALWHGTLENDIGKVSFTLKMIDTTSGVVGAIVSDGNGTFPAGEYPAAIAFNTSGSPATFTASVASIGLPAGETAFGTPFTRTLSFTANSGVTGQFVDRNTIRGQYAETLAAPAAPHLTRELSGAAYKFTLSKQSTAPSTWEPTLVAGN